MARFHDEGAAEAAEAHFDRLFKEHEAPEEMPEVALPEGDPLLADTLQAATDAGAIGVPEVKGGPYGSDLRHYAAAGIPTLQYGPGDVRYAHATDEHVAVAEVLHYARAYALLAVRRCAVGEE